MPSPSPIALSSKHDAAALAARYAERRRLQIRDALEPAGADRVLASLRDETPWGVAFNHGEKIAQLTGAQAAALTAEQRREIVATIHERARSSYQFFYDYFPLSRAWKDGEPVPETLRSLYEFLNTEPFLAFIRTVTGLDGISWADAHATRFRAGHFLKYHTDENAAEHRLAAYVLNFTPDWGRDWGGTLQFFDDRYDVEQGYRPLHNALNLFTVPADHSVSMVAAYVRASRLSVTGWFRGDAPPTRAARRA